MRKDVELMFDEGRTAQASSMLENERRCRRANGSGDDLADAVEWALEFADAVAPEEASEFWNPIDILMREEEDDM